MGLERKRLPLVPRIPRSGQYLRANTKDRREAAMTTLKNRTGRRALCAVIVTVGALIPSAGYSVPIYDGLWSVSIVTKKGDCDAGYRYPIRIAKGHLANAGDAAFTITGAVARTGTITVTVSAAGKSAHGSGRLAGNEGGGSWTGGSCSGSWTAERRGP